MPDASLPQASADTLALIERMTGEQLVDLLRGVARERGLGWRPFLRPLTTNPSVWASKLRRAHTPIPTTLTRIAALIAGDPIPPFPARNFSGARGPSRRRALTPTALIEDRLPPRVDRDPCPLCGVRGDLACRDRPWIATPPPSQPSEPALPLAEQVRQEALALAERRRRAWFIRAQSPLEEGAEP